MNCEDVELELSGGEPSAEAKAHLAGCASCQATAQVLGLAALPPVTDAERLVLRGLEGSTLRAWRAEKGRGAQVRRVGSLLLAAGLGALVASGLLLQTRAVEPRVETVYVAAPEVPVLELEEPNLSDDEVFFDVGWPSLTEGEL